MSDYIKREDAYREIMECFKNSEMPEEWENGMHTAGMIVLQDVPSADVVEAVRCKDCKYWDMDTLKHQLNDFREWDEAECECLAERDEYNEVDHYVESDDYCSYGERKDGESDE